MQLVNERKGRTVLIGFCLALLLNCHPARAISGENQPIDGVLGALPSKVFDGTTDGISDEDLKKLVETGETTDWKLKRPDGRSAVVTDKNPHTNSEVAIHVFHIGDDKFVKVAIQNEYVHDELYFKVGIHGVLRSFSPSKRLRAKMKS
jgi:hypothetical protein